MNKRAKVALGGTVLVLVAVFHSLQLITVDMKRPWDSIVDGVARRDVMTPDELELSKGLGSIEFDVQEKVPQYARDRFLFGLKAMALFWYDLAEEQFLRAQEIEPTFGMAYWGEAMSHMQFLWSAKQADHACRILDKIEDHNAIVAAQNMFYITSAKTLFGCDGGNLTDIQMVDKFSRMLKEALGARPNDVFLACLYSLSLMEKNYGGAHSPQVEEARRVLKGVLRDHPKYPYALHVYMHAYDWPGFAHEALAQAFVSLETLKASSHALHMPSHTFIRLGLWEDAIQSDRKALRVGDDFARKFKNGSYSYDAANRYHSLEWLQFELLQQGRYKEAEECLDRMRSAFLKDSSVPYRQWYYTMTARQWLETRHLNTEVLAEPVPFAVTAFWPLVCEMYYQLAYGLSVLKSSLPDRLSRAEGTIRRLAEMANQTKPLSQSLKNVTEFAKLQLQSQLELARVPRDSSQRFLRAFGIMEKAVEIQDGTLSTSSDPALPWALLPWEFYGDMILASNFTDNLSYMEKAVSLFQRSLDHYPNRSAALLGLVRVNLKRGNCTEASRSYDQLRKHWKPILSDQERKRTLVEEYGVSPNNCTNFWNNL